MAVTIAFTKMSGSGNDFIIIDNRDGKVENDRKRDFVRKVCARRTGVGADGVIFVENSEQVDFRWDFYNEDGSSAEMCGNGGRCVARYAFERNIAPQKMRFETLAGIIEGEVDGANVKIKLTSPKDLEQNREVTSNGTEYHLVSIDTGVPHAVVFSDNVDADDVVQIGRAIRHHEAFAPAGTNVNLVQKKDGHSLKVRTYERGVEDETLACGTGVVAAAIVANCQGKVESPVDVETRGGETLKVYFKQSKGSYSDVYLEGLTQITFEGTLVDS